MKEMLSFFPSPYSDEDYRSIIYRYHLRSQNVNIMTTKHELFNIKGLKNNPFPRNYYNLKNKVYDKGIPSLEEIINEHTIFPLYRPFIPSNYIKVIFKEFKYGNRENTIINSMFDTESNRILSEHIRYCPLCLEKDFETYGEAYIHRGHQISFINFCPKHSINFITTCPGCNELLVNKNADMLITTPSCKCGVRLSQFLSIPKEDKEFMDFKVDLLKDITILMKSQSLNREFILYKFIIHLQNKGYLYFSGGINKKKLFCDFLEEYPLEKLKDLLIPESYITSKEIQTKLFRSNNKVQNILLYILFMRFLAGKVENFLSFEKPISIKIPFGNGPWPCINPICPDFKNHSIKMCNRIKRRSGILGIFKCNSCGQKYKRMWEYKNDTINSPKLMEMGDLFEEILIDYYNQGIDNREIAKRIGIHEKRVQYNLLKLIKKEDYIKRKKVSIECIRAYQEIESGNKQISVDLEIKDIQDNYRGKIKGLLENFKVLSRMEIRQMVGETIYNWLMKNDRAWIENKLPKRQVSLDWSMIDIDLAKKIEKVAKEIYESNPARRIRANTIISKLSKTDIGRINIMSDKLPLSTQELNKWIESYEDYKIRHIPIVIKNIEKNKQKVTLKRICYEAIMYKDCSEKVKQKIIEELERLGYIEDKM
jgi:hypothetical protein